MGPWMWAAVAWGGGVYINGTLVDPASLASVELEGVDLTFDDAGNVRITAEGYQVQVVGTSPGQAPTASTRAPAGGTAPAAGAAGVAAAHYWLVTEDSGSVGHRVECWINGQRALVVASGEAQRIVDIGRWLRPGENRVEMRAVSRSASGGNLYVYVGTGRADASGTVLMDDPAVQFGLSPSRKGETKREYAFLVE